MLLDDFNTVIGASVPEHEYHGFRCRFTGLKGHRDDDGLAGQLIAGSLVDRQYRFVVVVPSGYVGPVEPGDTFHIGATVPLIDLDTDFDAAAARLLDLLPRRLQALHALIDQHVDAAGAVVGGDSAAP